MTKHYMKMWNRVPSIHTTNIGLHLLSAFHETGMCWAHEYIGLLNIA